MLYTLTVCRGAGVASFFETANNVLWEYYWPQFIIQNTTPMIWDTEEHKQYLAALRTKLESLSQEEAKAFFASIVWPSAEDDDV